MKRTFFALSRIFSLVVWGPMLSLSLTACTPDEVEDTDIYCAHQGHPHAVDLGLSVKWACCNISTEKPESPEEYGDYFAWGDPEKKDSYTWSTYKWNDNDTGELTKYNGTDSKTILELTDDTAQALWGDEWRMPTQAEMQELMDRCTWTWTSVNGVYGYRVSGNGNSIFLPAAGSQYEDLYTSQGSQGCYMSSTLYGDDYELEICLGFNKKDRYTINSDRCDGHTIRPVKK